MHNSPMKTNDKARDARLFAYTLVAGAAALHGQAVDAAIEYFDIDDISIGQGGSQYLYINGDTQTDILLKNYVFAFGNYQGAFIPYIGGKLVGTKPGSLVYASALSAGDPIDPTTADTYFVASLAYGNVNPQAEFINVTDAYIGFSFPAAEGPDIFYAWVRVDIDNAAGTFIIKDFAFENIPGTGILAGATTGGGLDGDLNSDGFVGIADLNIVLGNWNQNVTAGDFLLGDPSGDGFVGIADLNTVLGNWNAGTPAAPASAAIPEPGTLSLLAAGAAGVSMWRRRRR